MAKAAHRIGELHMHLRAPDAATAETWGHAVQDMLEDRLLPLFEVAFDRLSPGTDLRVIDRLELDLGTVGTDPQALSTALSAVLALLQTDAPGASPDQGSADAVDLIATYLLRGGLPLPDPTEALKAAWSALVAWPAAPLSLALIRLAPLFTSPDAALRFLESAPPALLHRMAHALAGDPAFEPPPIYAPQAREEAPVLAALQVLALAPQDKSLAKVLVAALSGAPAPAPAPAPAKSIASPRYSASPHHPKTNTPLSATPSHRSDPLPLAVPGAGLVLLHPFLSPYFDRLGLLAGPGRFADTSARSRAVRLAQQLATGQNSAPEADCPLAKLLCGMDPAVALLAEKPAASETAVEADQLLVAVIGHWSRLGRTTPEGLRQGFLLRPGLLQRKGEGWLLRVEKRGVDVLLDGLPWTIGLVRTPFMGALLQVDWR